MESGAELSSQVVVSGYRMQRTADSASLSDTATQDSASWQADRKHAFIKFTSDLCTLTGDIACCYHGDTSPWSFPGQCRCHGSRG